MSFDVRVLAAQKHLETQHAEVEWMKALESARQSLKFIDIDFHTLEVIALACRSPLKFVVMTRLIYQYGKSHLQGDGISDLILQLTDESPFSLPDWIDAIEYLYQWLQANSRKIDFLTMLKYLECCVASPDAREGGQTLSSLVQDMLQVHGYDG